MITVIWIMERATIGRIKGKKNQSKEEKKGAGMVWRSDDINMVLVVAQHNTHAANHNVVAVALNNQNSPKFTENKAHQKL